MSSNDLTYNFKKVIYNGFPIPDYFVNPFGVFFSIKQGDMKKLTISYPSQNDTNKYPRIRLSLNSMSKTYLVHRLVCETFHPIPLPKELSNINWTVIPEKERNMLYTFATHCDRYQVNHIDHDPFNFKASNLEWVTVKENQYKYQQHKQNKLNNINEFNPVI